MPYFDYLAELSLTLAICFIYYIAAKQDAKDTTHIP